MQVNWIASPRYFGIEKKNVNGYIGNIIPLKHTAYHAFGPRGGENIHETGDSQFFWLTLFTSGLKRVSQHV